MQEANTNRIDAEKTENPEGSIVQEEKTQTCCIACRKLGVQVSECTHQYPLLGCQFPKQNHVIHLYFVVSVSKRLASQHRTVVGEPDVTEDAPF